MERYAILRSDGTLEYTNDVLKWGRWFEDSEARRVAETVIGDVRVSTVCLGLNHNFMGGPPLWFETMIFGGKHDEYQERYSTLDEARRGHDRTVARVNGEIPWDNDLPTPDGERT